MPPKTFKCKQCGNCCLNLSDAFQTSVSDEEIALWEIKGRYDILEWVNSIHLGDEYYIHDVKPEHCQNYPKSREHAEKTGCRGFE